MKTPPLLFFFDGMEVGEFPDGVYPLRDGEVHYEPYRGPGHFEFQAKLKAAGSADCYFYPENEKITFRVVGCPHYGVLSICEVTNKVSGA